MAEEEINTLEEERRLIRDQINDKTSELKTLRSLFSNYHVDVPRQIVEIGAKLKNPALSRKARQVLIQEQAGLRYDARQYDAGIRTREREIKELQAQLRDLDDKKKRSKEHEENTIALQRNFENNNEIVYFRDIMFLHNSSSTRLEAEQRKFKNDLCEHHIIRVRYFEEREIHQYLIRCMVTDCWLPNHECIAAHMFPRHFHNIISEVVLFFRRVDINSVRNGMLWATAIETAFSQNEVCLLYNPFGQKLMFFVLNPELQDQVICRDGNLPITFGKVDGKVLDIDAKKLPRLRLVLQQANRAIFQTRSMIESGERNLPPRHWDTVTTLQSMMQDDSIRLVRDPDVALENSVEVFAKYLSPSHHEPGIRKLAKIHNQGVEVFEQQPMLRSVDEVMRYYRDNPKLLSASSRTASVGSFDRQAAFEIARERCTELQKQNDIESASGTHDLYSAPFIRASVAATAAEIMAAPSASTAKAISDDFQQGPSFAARQDTTSSAPFMNGRGGSMISLVNQSRRPMPSRSVAPKQRISQSSKNPTNKY